MIRENQIIRKEDSSVATKNSQIHDYTTKLKTYRAFLFFFSSRRRHTRFDCDWSSDVCSSDLSLGAKVIGVVGSDAKAELARKHGCRHVLISGRDALVASVKELTRGTGVAVVYDAVGKDTFVESLDCLRRLGMMATFGNASGPPPAISPLELSKRGSLFLTRQIGRASCRERV